MIGFVGPRLMPPQYERDRVVGPRLMPPQYEARSEMERLQSKYRKYGHLKKIEFTTFPNFSPIFYRCCVPAVRGKTEILLVDGWRFMPEEEEERRTMH